LPDAPRAIIDIGTNTVLMLVGVRAPDGKVQVVRDDAIITRLGRGADASGELDAGAVQQTLAALRSHGARAHADGVSEIVAVATESLRMARNRDTFLGPAQAILGVPVRMISGEEEAQLSYLSVASEEPHGELRVIDIGGGSTEIVAGRGEQVSSVMSHRIGSVRLTERHAGAQVVPPATLELMQAQVRTALAAQPLEPLPLLCGLAGTVTTAAALLLGLSSYDREAVDGSQFGLERIIGLRDELAAQSASERAVRPCLAPGRADVIVAGLAILTCAMEHCGAQVLKVRDRGVRYALL
jgi:exopolyphosphatase/guanosine-5'-triphosphate,3'-diphosphate pyrophosphatase